MKFWWILIGIALVALWIGFKPLQAPRVPDSSFVDIDGQSHSLAAYRGQPILLIFWATDCPSCVQEIPELIELYHHYTPQGLVMLSIALAHDRVEQLHTMRQQRALPYVIAWDEHSQLVRAFDQVRVTPTHFLVSPEGHIVMRKIGVLDRHTLETHLTKMGLSAP